MAEPHAKEVGFMHIDYELKYPLPREQTNNRNLQSTSCVAGCLYDPNTMAKHSPGSVKGPWKPITDRPRRESDALEKVIRA